MNAHWEETTGITERADQWLELIKSGKPYDRAEFLRWLKQSPVHVREMLRVTTWDKILDHTLDPKRKIDIDALMRSTDSNVVRLDHDSRRETQSPPLPAAQQNAPNTAERRTRRQWLTGLATAACLILALAMGWLQQPNNAEAQSQFNTAIGEQRSVSLSDGSVVNLNTQSRVKVAFSAAARDIFLLEGQAIFKVRHDATRPFRVHVGSSVVQAIGTQFDVYRLKDRTSVAVIEGIVQVIPNATGLLDAEALAKLPANTRVPAGQSIAIVADGTVTEQAKVDTKEAGAWRQRRLVFHKSTVAEIAAEFNRYNQTQIRVEGDALRAEQRFSGVFDADDPESLLAYLGLDGSYSYVHNGNEFVIRLTSSLAQSAQE